MKRWVFAAALVGILWTQIEITPAYEQQVEPADTIIHHAKVLTVDAKFTIADADLDHLVGVYSPAGAFTASIGWYRAGAGTVATSLAEQPPPPDHRISTPASLVDRIDSTSATIAAEISESERTLIGVTRTIAQLVDRLQSQVASEGLYDLPQTPAFLPTAAEPNSG